MKICIVTDFFIPHYNGGGERRYFEIARRLVKKGHKVDLICMGIKGVASHEIIDGINVYHIGPQITKPPERTAFDFIKFFLAIIKWILSHDYDLIDAQSYSPLLPAFFSAKLKRIPIIGTIHDVSTAGSDQWIQSSKMAGFLEKILVRIPYNRILSVSNETKRVLVDYYGVPDERVKVVYAGVDLEFIDSVKINKKDQNSIIFVGRLIPHKHVDHLLDVVNSLKSEIPEVKLKIVGTGKEKENLENMVTSLHLENHVEFFENLEYGEVIAQIKKSNVLVLPSTREGFGMVLTEANACMIPVVAYSSGGVVEVIDDDENGFLVKALELKILKEKIKFLLENPSENLKMGINGRNKVENNFTWDIIVKEYEKVMVVLHGHCNDNSPA